MPHGTPTASALAAPSAWPSLAGVAASRRSRHGHAAHPATRYRQPPSPTRTPAHARSCTESATSAALRAPGRAFAMQLRGPVQLGPQMRRPRHLAQQVTPGMRTAAPRTPVLLHPLGIRSHHRQHPGEPVPVGSQEVAGFPEVVRGKGVGPPPRCLLRELPVLAVDAGPGRGAHHSPILHVLHSAWPSYLLHRLGFNPQVPAYQEPAVGPWHYDEGLM